MEQINKLQYLKSKDKFSEQEWENRGLNPSDKTLSNKLEMLFNNLLDEIIISLNNQPNEKELKTMIKRHLSKFKASDYDTEEREFICDYFEEIASVVNLNISKELNSWLYGKVLENIFKLSSILKKPEKILNTLTQQCRDCKSDLETFILEKDESVPDYSYYVVRCKSCGELNLLDFGPKIKRVKFGNYELVEQLEKDKYDLEEAEIRLKQIKFFRK